MACLAYAMLLHLIVGFAINEVYIMACHWLWVIPLSMGYLFAAPSAATSQKHPATTPLLPSPSLNREGRGGSPLRIILWAITLYLWVYHTLLLYHYLTWPLSY
jgi:hypothetical protein